MRNTLSQYPPIITQFAKVVTLALVCLLCVKATMTFAADNRISIGTGGKAGVYYPAGGAICNFANQGLSDFKCRVRTTKGSLDNLRKLRSGQFDIVVARSDWAKWALNGTGKFGPAGQHQNLRSLFSLHSEPFTILARSDAKIDNLNDLRGKRINFGSPSSALASQFLPALGWGVSDFAAVGSKKTNDQGSALCKGQFDAVVYTVGFPSGWVQRTTKQCPVSLVNLTGRRIDTLVASSKELSKVTIPGGLYIGVDTPTETFGYRATILTRAGVPDEVIYGVVKSTFQNLEKMRTLHPAWRGLKHSEMIRDSLVAPLHPGALKYYRERGWLK